MKRIVSVILSVFFASTVKANFELVLVHSGAANQPTTTGKSITEIKSYGDSVYLGYGDFGANTGPIDICKFTPPDSTLICEFTLSTEKIDRYRILNGSLYAPAIDPSSPNEDGYAVKTLSGTWSAVSSNKFFEGPKPPAHIFDMNYYDGKLWAVGSQRTSSESAVPPFTDDGDAAIWSSSNNGTSWSISLDIQQIDNCCARVYFSGIHGDKLYVQAVDYDEFHPLSKVYDGTSWTDGPNLLVYGSATNGNNFDGKLLMRQSSSLVSFDGNSVTQNYSGIADYTIFEDYVYVLTFEKEVYRSRDLLNWGFVDSLNVSSNVHSIEVKDFIVYIGTSDSRVYKSDVLVPYEENCTDFLPSILYLLDDG